MESLSHEQLVCVMVDHRHQSRWARFPQKTFTRDNAEQRIRAFLAAICSYEEHALRGYLHPESPITRLYFSALTGVVLGRTATDMRTVLAEWAQLQTPLRAPLSRSAR